MQAADAAVNGGLAPLIPNGPNCTLVECHGTDGVAHMGMYALRDIQAGEPLNLNYPVMLTAQQPVGHF